MLRILLPLLFALFQISAAVANPCDKFWDISHPYIADYCQKWGHRTVLDPTHLDSCPTKNEKGSAWRVSWEGTQWSLFNDAGAIANVKSAITTINLNCPEKARDFYQSLFKGLLESQGHNTDAQCALYECCEWWIVQPYGYLRRLYDKGQLTAFRAQYDSTRPTRVSGTTDDPGFVHTQSTSSNDAGETTEEPPVVEKKGKVSGISGLPDD